MFPTCTGFGLSSAAGDFEIARCLGFVEEGNLLRLLDVHPNFLFQPSDAAKSGAANHERNADFFLEKFTPRQISTVKCQN